MNGISRVGVAATLAMALILAGCAPGDTTESGDASAPIEVTIGTFGPPETFDVANMNWGRSLPYSQAVFDGLLRAKENGVDVEPWLAVDWSYDETKTILTMDLQEGVNFTDGTDFTAQVAADNLIRFRDGQSPQRSKAAKVVSASAEDDLTLRVELSEPDPAFLINLTQVAGLQQSPATFASEDAATNPVGSGPYILDASKTVAGSSYVFTRNPDYWSPSSQHFETITVKAYPESTALLNALRGKQLNAAYVQDNSSLPQIEDAGYTVDTTFLSLVGFFMFDRAGALTPALGDTRVRQAINLAIDGEAMLEVVEQGLGNPTGQVFRPVSQAWDESLDAEFPYDPERARELMAAAGYADGFDMTIPTSSFFPQAVYPIVQQQLAEIGVRVTLADVGLNLYPDMRAAKYSATVFQLQQDPSDAQLVSFMLSRNAAWNPFKYGDDVADEYIADVLVGNEEAAASAAALNRHVTTEAWFDPWYTRQASFVTDSIVDVTMNQAADLPYLYDIVPAE